MFILKMDKKNIAFYTDDDLKAIDFNKDICYPASYFFNEMEPKLKAMEGTKKIHYRVFVCTDDSPNFFYNEMFNVELKQWNKDMRFYVRNHVKCHYKTSRLICDFYSKYYYDRNYYDGSDTEIDD